MTTNIAIAFFSLAISYASANRSLKIPISATNETILQYIAREVTATFRNLRLALVPVAVLSGGLFFGSIASASVINTLLIGSTGTVTVSLSSLIFNNDPAALPLGTCTTTVGRGCNSDAATNTSLTFVGGPLATGEGIYVNNNDLTLSTPSAADANTFLTFASHPNLVFSISSLGPGSSITNCATALTNGLSCSLFAGSPIVLTYLNGHTSASVGVAGKVSDTGVAGLAGGSSYTGGFSQTFTGLLPNGNAPTPQNMQLYFCPSGTCIAADFASGKSVTTSQSGSFTSSAAVLGDYNHNGTVDAADYVVWRKGLGTVYTQNDYNVWRANFGKTAGSGSGATANAAVPEPSTLLLTMFAAAGWRSGEAGTHRNVSSTRQRVGYANNPPVVTHEKLRRQTSARSFWDRLASIPAPTASLTQQFWSSFRSLLNRAAAGLSLASIGNPLARLGRFHRSTFTHLGDEARLGGQPILRRPVGPTAAWALDTAILPLERCYNGCYPNTSANGTEL